MAVQVIILAAGAGTRMKSDLPKVMHRLAGKSMLEHVIDAVPKALTDSVTVVVGHKKDIIKSTFEGKGISFADQDEQLGTGHAVKCAASSIKDDQTQLILYGDAPMILETTIRRFIEAHETSDCSISVMTACLENPYGYGRIIKDPSGHIRHIVEEKDCTPAERLIKEINSGIMLVESGFLKQALDQLKNANQQKEYYLTDIVAMADAQGLKTQAFVVDPVEIQGINSRVQLQEAALVMNQRKLIALMDQGVTIVDMASTFIDHTVEIDYDTIIEPFTLLRGQTRIGKNCVIGPGARLTDTVITDSVVIKDSTLVESRVDAHSVIGPYAYLRPKSDIGKHVKVGDFVEIKNARISDHSKVSHLSYIGDGHIGERVNIGCGVVFVNYDGYQKFKTVVEDGAFVGCNSNLVAPVTVGQGAYVAAGSTITEDVPANSLAIARERQSIKTNWTKTR